MSRALGLLFSSALLRACTAARKIKIQKDTDGTAILQVVHGKTDNPWTCSGHGHWVSPINSDCVCDGGWTGSDCSETAQPPQNVSAECYTPGGSDGQTSCEWYPTCLTARFPACKDHALEYSESYGQTYCQRFTDRISDFSAAGQLWVHAVKACLQEELVRDVLRQEVEVADCREIRRRAFDSHPRCYLQPDSGSPLIGICSLAFTNPGDIVTLIQTTWDALFSRESVRQILAVAVGCVFGGDAESPAASGVGFLHSVVMPALEKGGYTECAQMVAETVAR